MQPPRGNDGGSDRQGGKTEFAGADRISRTFRRRYDNRVGYLLHHLTVHPEHQEQGGGENPIGKFLSVTGPRNGVAGAAVATSISRGSDCDDGGSGGSARCERRAYKLHTITLSRNSTVPTCPTKIALRPFQLIYLMSRFALSRKEGKKEKYR